MNIRDQMSLRILVLDGAMGTMIQQLDLTAEDFGGEEYEGCNEYLCETMPDAIEAIHRSYLEAGADIISTNTFGSTPLVLAEYELAHKAYDLNLMAAQIARRAVDAMDAVTELDGKSFLKFVAGSMGPTTKSLSVTGGATFDELADTYEVQVRGLIDGGVDLLLLETSQDLLNVKAAHVGMMRAFAATGKTLPIIISGTIEPMGTTLAGQTIEAFYLAVEHMHPLAVGLNCATGPEFMRDHVRALATLSATGVSCYPNAGLPDENGHYHETPASFAKKISDFAAHGWLNIVGGCCGTTPNHIREVRQVVDAYVPRVWHARLGHAVSGLEAVFLETDNRPLFVGERTNVIGSRKFRRLIADANFDAAAEVARAQVKSGAHVVDICLADPDRDEVEDMENFLPHVVRKIKAPVMIDSTDAAVVELALKQTQGKSIINSTNLEDGEERLARVARLATAYGAALVVGTIDEKGMAVTRERKLEVAKRSVEILTEKYGLAASDIIIDPLTFPVGTGDVNYIGSAAETVEGIRLIKQHLPECAILLGVSNVSFGLPPAGREVLNSVFLYHCTRAGLDYAIVNTEKLERFASLSDDERRLAESLLFATTDDIVAEFTAQYRDKKVQQTVREDLPLHERLARSVVEGSKIGLEKDLTEALETQKPLEIINGPLMDGMNEVGRLFNNNELIVAEVLQSAEVMKVSVAFLEPHMEKSESATKATILLATVKGDVHDIGKNLVEIILANNGFRVINLGIKVGPDQLIQAYREHQPDMIGLSGLLVKSAQQMVLTADDLRQSGVDVPLLVGGAALTKKFALTRINPEYGGTVVYAKDAMDGLDLANRLIRPDTRVQLQEQIEKETVAYLAAKAAKPSVTVSPVAGTLTSTISRTAPIFTPPDYTRHVLREFSLSHVRPYINWQMLLGKHLGVRGNVEKRLAEGDAKAVELYELVTQLLNDAARENWLQPKAVYQFFKTQAHGNTMLIFDEAGENVVERFQFPRQITHAAHLCLADFVRPQEQGVFDNIALFAVTAGTGIRQQAETLKAKGDYLRSHAIQSLALELAEACAERLHHIIRDAWGFPDNFELTMRERFIARYQGIRVSFGYPACPNLDDQAQLFRLLRPEDIGIELTDGFMMDPEASVSAMVFSHPEAKYFNIGDDAEIGGAELGQ